MRMRKRESREVHLNLTPLIDVVFLLLLFFMVSTTFKKNAELGIELPQAELNALQDADANTVEIVIDNKGEYFVKGAKLRNNDLNGLKSVLSNLIAENKNTKNINKNNNISLVIVGDKDAPHQAVVTAMDAAGQVGIHRLKIVAENTATK